MAIVCAASDDALLPRKPSLVRVERLLRLAILLLIFIAAFYTRLFSIVRFESIIHEFDPWFNYRATQKLTTDGFYSFWNWFDDRSWYPLGRVVGGTVYPGLMLTAAVLHKVLWTLNMPLDIRNICVFLAPFFSMLTSYAMYLLTAEFHSKTAGLFAAGFMAIVPGYISRSVAGSYDNEAIAIFLLVYCFFLWIKAVKLGSVMYGVASAMAYFYMVSAWGGYAFITNMIPLHVFVLLLMGRYSNKLYTAYCTWYAIGTISTFTIPFVNIAPVQRSEHMAPLGIFGLLQIVAFAEYLRTLIPKTQFKYFLRAFVLLFFAVSMAALVALTYSGVIAPWTGRFYSLFDTGYAKIHIPIIASVSEHQPTAWISLFFDMHFLIVLLPAGLLLCFRRLRNEHVFIVVYCLLGSYFSGVMIRLILTLTPIVCSVSGIALGEAFQAIFGSAADQDHTSLTCGQGHHHEHAAAHSDSNFAQDVENAKSDEDYFAATSAVDLDGQKEGGFRKRNTNSSSSKYAKNKHLREAAQNIEEESSENEDNHKASMDDSGADFMHSDHQNAKKNSRLNNVKRPRSSLKNRDASSAATYSPSNFVAKVAFVGVLAMMSVVYVLHCTWVTSMAYSSPSVVLSSNLPNGQRFIIDDFREAYYWLRKNTPEDATVMSWWDYGYQLAGMANRTTIVDNNTWNNTHIATVGRAMASSEDKAYPLLRKLDVDYVLVMFGGLIGYSGDDINKFLWMIRIGQGVYPKHVTERKFFTEQGEYRVDDRATATMRSSIMYKMSYYRFNDVFGGKAQDRVRGSEISSKPIDFHTMDEAFTSEHWIVRIYQVRKPDFLGRTLRQANAFAQKIPRRAKRVAEDLA